MTDLSLTLKERLRETVGKVGYDLVDCVAIPIGDHLVQIKSLEEALLEFDRGTRGTGSEGFGETKEELRNFLIQLRTQVRVPAPLMESRQLQDLQEIQNPQPQQQAVFHDEKIYLSDGNMNAPFLMKNAELLFKAKDYTLARNIYRALYQNGDQPAFALMGLAQCEEAEGRMDQAKHFYEESIAYHPTLEAYQRLTWLLIQLRKENYAAEVLERALCLPGIDAKVKYELSKACGNCWMKTEKASRAERHYKAALELEGPRDEILSNLGSLYLKEGKLLEAKKSFQESIHLNKKNDRAFIGLGSCLLKEGNKRLAHECFANALRIELRQPYAIYYLVKCAFEIKFYSTAEQLLSAYVQIAPVNANLLYSLAGLQFHLGNLQASEKTIQKILRIRSDHKGALELLKMIGSRKRD